MAHAAATNLAPASARKSRVGKTLGIVAWVALVIIAVAFILKYVFHYYLHYNAAAFDPTGRAAAACCSTSPEAWSPCSPPPGNSSPDSQDAA
jgi:hypothetical protein